MRHLARRLLLAASGQCSKCGGWFDDWNGGICSACRAVGR
jgi:hypothetical protein